MLVEKIAIYLLKETIRLKKINTRKMKVSIDDDWECMELRVTYWKKSYGNRFKYESWGYDKRFFYEKYREAGFNPNNLILWSTDLSSSQHITNEVEAMRMQLKSSKSSVKKPRKTKAK